MSPWRGCYTLNGSYVDIEHYFLHNDDTYDSDVDSEHHIDGIAQKDDSDVDIKHHIDDIAQKDDSDVDIEHHIDDIAQKDDSDVDIEHHIDDIAQKDYSDLDIKHYVNDFLQKDDEKAFVAFVNSRLRRPLDETWWRVLHPYKLLVSVCYHGAAKCGDALLNGKTGYTVTVDFPLIGMEGLYPIRFAALVLSPALTRLFIEKGASADVIGYNTDLKIHGLLPVNIAVEALSKQIDWDSRKNLLSISRFLPFALT